MLSCEHRSKHFLLRDDNRDQKRRDSERDVHGVRRARVREHASDSAMNRMRKQSPEYTIQSKKRNHDVFPHILHIYFYVDQAIKKTYFFGQSHTFTAGFHSVPVAHGIFVGAVRPGSHT